MMRKNGQTTKLIYILIHLNSKKRFDDMLFFILVYYGLINPTLTKYGAKLVIAWID